MTIRKTIATKAFGDQKPGTSGLGILMHGGARNIYRLSGTGTGTEGATLRVYVEGHETDPARQNEDPQKALAELIGLASQLAEIEHYTGRSSPDVVT